MLTLNINGEPQQLEITGDMPVLWALRDIVGLTGSKYGCGMAMCGACTVHVDGKAVRSCVLPAASVVGQKITTIEAIQDDPVGRAVQAAWRELNVVQCGYCQSGMIMSAVGLLAGNRNPSDSDVDAAMSGNLCRCGTYQRIRAAVHRAAELLG
jgi:isoquinoline 1-oxidoreductase subunit alpha